MHPVVADLTTGHLRALDAALPGACLGLYLTGSVAAGDFHPHTSDVDAVVVLDAVPQDCSALRAVHEGIAGPPAYDVVYVTPADLAGDPGAVTRAPGTLDGQWREGPLRAHVSPVTWAEMARYAGPGGEPPGGDDHHPHDRLVAFTRRNLEDYWAPLVDRVDAAVAAGQVPAGEASAGESEGPAVTPQEVADTIMWTVLGLPRLHALLVTGHVVSKTAAGQYALEQFPERAELIRRCLRSRAGEDVAFADADAAGVVALGRAVLESARVLPDPAPAVPDPELVARTPEPA
jgi:hypothetical protein